MKLTLDWLKELVDCSAPPAELAELLTMAGLEVESLVRLSDPGSTEENWLFEIAVTPNRGDCLGITGIARELAALTGAQLKSPPASPADAASGPQRRFPVTIKARQLCPRYSARIVEDLTIGPAPQWLRHRLESCGIRAINNVVDVTNYVMLETGQPLHAFDLATLKHERIVVRTADAPTRFTTLDGVERELVADDLLICDGPEPVALAGIMGGVASEVKVATRSVLLESAHFAPTAIRRTARRLGLRSEASHRFERGVDPDGTVAALDRAVYLLQQVTASARDGGLTDRYPRRVRPPTILLRDGRVERLLGLRIERARSMKLLEALGMKTRERRSSLTVVPPSSRPDITREADVIEELARLYGYGRIPTTIPPIRPRAAAIDVRLGWERKLRWVLAGEGLAEAINLPFTTTACNRHFKGLQENGAEELPVLNPLTKDHSAMRRSLIPGLIENLRLNRSYKASGFNAFHMGKIFWHKDGAIGERQCLGGIMQGLRPRRGLRSEKDRPVGFFECKGVVEAVLDLFRVSDSVTWSRAKESVLHPGRGAQVRRGSELVGYIGEIHPDLAQELDLTSFFLFELDFEKLLEYAPRRITLSALPRFPAVERDVALVVERDFAAEQIIHWIKNLDEALIENVEVFDQYQGPPIAAGKKSLAFKISYRAGDRTLTDAEINELHQGLAARLGETFSAGRRS